MQEQGQVTPVSTFILQSGSTFAEPRPKTVLLRSREEAERLDCPAPAGGAARTLCFYLSSRMILLTPSTIPNLKTKLSHLTPPSFGDAKQPMPPPRYKFTPH